MFRLLLFVPVLLFSTAFNAFWAVIIGLFKKYTDFSFRYILHPWARSLVWAAGTRVQVVGTENIDPEQHYLVLSNHQSNMDIPVLISGIPLKMTIIAKTELFKIPVFGRGMRSFGILEIDRSNREQAIRTLRQAAQILRENNISILAFPEGTRSRDGKLHSFKKGPFVLAVHEHIPILPVSVSGTFPILPKGQLKIHPGRVKLVIHPPINTENFNIENRSQLMDLVHKTIARGLDDH